MSKISTMRVTKEQYEKLKYVQAALLEKGYKNLPPELQEYFKSQKTPFSLGSIAGACGLALKIWLEK